MREPRTTFPADEAPCASCSRFVGFTASDINSRNRLVCVQCGTANSALVLVYTAYYPMCFRICSRILRNASDAEDAAMAVFEELCKQPRINHNVGAYLCKAARSRSLDIIRRKAARSRSLDIIRKRKTDEPPTRVVVRPSSRITELEVRDVLLQLSEHDRRLAADLELGRDSHELARDRRVTEGAIRMAILRLRQRLARIL